MRFACGIFLAVSLFSGIALTQTAPAKSAASRAAQRVPSEEFATVLQTYHTSLSSAQTRAAEVVRSDPENRAAVRVGSEKNPVAQTGKPAQTKFYEAEAAEASLVSLKVDMLAKVPANDKPLKRYIEARFPSTPPARNGYISESDMESTNEAAEGLVMELRSLEGFAVDLKVTANAEHARFSYVGAFDPDGRDELSIYTDNTIPQMWRGPYAYTATKKGFWPVKDTFNTVSQKGNTMECTLVSTKEPEGGQCILK
jgi:hypothetical protein